MTVLNCRSSVVREIAYHRHPSRPDTTEARVTCHGHDSRGVLVHSADPRLGKAGLANFTYQTDLTGHVLRTRSVDAGSSITLNDAANRPLISVNSILTRDEGAEDFSQAIIQTWQYEGQSLPGRPLAVAEGVTGEPARVTERCVYASLTPANTNLNLVGQCIRHYDPAGLVAIGSVGLTGAVLSTTRQLLKDAENPALQADWQGDDADAWNSLLAADLYTSLCTADATGSPHFTRDAAGHKQRLAYDLAGVLRASWLTVNGGSEQPIVTALTYSAMGQKLDELHGNGVVSSYRYDPQTQRLTGIRNERPAGHASGAKVLQDLHYQYDPVGNVLNVENTAQPTTLFHNQKVAPQSTYVYDSLYQLASATGRQMAGDESANFTRYSRAYNYDNAGNLLQIRHSTADTANSSTTNITVSDRSNRAVLSTLAATPAEVDALFAAGGNQKRLQPGQMLAWTPRIELRSVTPVVRDGAPDDIESYRYDANRQRVLKTSLQKTNGSLQATQVLYLPCLELRTTHNGDHEKEQLQVICIGETGNAQARLLHWQSGKPPDIENNQVRYHHDDLIGSCGLEVDKAGKIISLEEYYPFGATALWAQRNLVEAGYKSLRYSGKERDGTGLYYYGFRYYQAELGRWLSADPAATVDGLNLYFMVRNNPCTDKDMYGLNRITAQGLENFNANDRDKVTTALGDAHDALSSVLENWQDIPSKTFEEFFGIEYKFKHLDILDTLQKTSNLLLQYKDSDVGRQKFQRSEGNNDSVLAQASTKSPDGFIYMGDGFFKRALTRNTLAATLIHEISHLPYILDLSAEGPATRDFFYLTTGINNREQIMQQNNLTSKTLNWPAGLFKEISAITSVTFTPATRDTVTYENGRSTETMSVLQAISIFNKTPLLQTSIAAKNADNIAYFVTTANSALKAPRRSQ